MATLGDPLTPTVVTSETGGVSIKVEQGVLYENNDEYEGSRSNAEKQDIQTVKYESNHTNNTSRHVDESSMFNITHSIFEPDFEIKEEPNVDIDDRHPDEEVDENTSFQSQSPNESPNRATKISLTPTSKLIASTNGPTDSKRRYACPYENCTKSYGKSSHLRSHLTWHTGIKPFVCKEAACGKGFTRSDELNRHIRTHTGEKPFECVQCTKKFSRSDHLTKHLATHTKQLSAQKKIKLEKNVSQGTLKTTSTMEPVTMKDDQNAKVIVTTVFETNFDSPELISARDEASHAISLQIKLEKPEDSDDYACQKLPAQQLEQSINNVSNVLVKHEPLEVSHVSESAEASYANEPDDDAVMPEANLPPLPSLLNQTINQMANSVYDPTRPFPCCRCTKSFKRQDDLNRHMRTHTGEKPFACNECDKRFMRSDHLKKHMNTHTRVR